MHRSLRVLRRCSNNLNQYARRVNETGSVYAADIEETQARLEKIWRQTEEILSALGRIQQQQKLASSPLQ